MNAPLATYRLQLRPSFDFSACQAVLPYLAELGISHVYASPVFTARPGSEHGYDVCDHNRFNPELGGEAAFERLTATRRALGLGWIQDIVPNHMAVSGGNRMLADLLENGPASRFHPFFDIDWDHPYEGLRGRMLAPFLGGLYGRTLENGQIALGFDEDGFFARYFALRLPLRIDSYAPILTRNMAKLRDALGRDHPDYVKFMGALHAIKTLPARDPDSGRYEQICYIKRLLLELRQSCPVIRRHLERALEEINGTGPGGPERFDALDAILAEQHFRLSYWKVAGEEINYRRFFSVNDLISLRVENEAVFEHAHGLILKKLADKTFSGLRVDHIDGLYDPSAYLRRLRRRAGRAYLAVEKILTGEEALPACWPVQGTTGYDFLNDVLRLFTDGENRTAFDKVYAAFLGERPNLEAIVARKKNWIIKTHMSGDVDNLARLVKGVSSRDRHALDVTFNSLRKALAEVMVQFPVYRTYVDFDSAREADLASIREAVQAARRRRPELAVELRFLERFLLLDFGENMSAGDRRRWIHFVMRFQQVTGPLMAKGLEDSAFYEYNRLLCLNEVGGDPGRFGLTAEAFHRRMAERAAAWPDAMNATATHDHKRGEDARMRLAALSEVPEIWRESLRRLRRASARKRRKFGGQSAPVPNDVYFLFQTMVASLPFDPKERETFPARIKAYAVKALREAKSRSSWINPDEAYERACLSFLDALLRPRPGNPFPRELEALVERLAVPAACDSLAQTLIKVAAPGLPDIYQGTELWDFSLVDPDNRRPVDFEARRTALRQLGNDLARDPTALCRDLLATFKDGRIKLFVLSRALAARAKHAELFRRGGYAPLAFAGERAGNLFGFARRNGNQAVVCLVPLRTARAAAGAWPLADFWGATRVLLPEGFGTTVAKDLLTGRPLGVSDGALNAADVLARLPVALVGLS